MKKILALLLLITPSLANADEACAKLDSEQCINSSTCILDQKGREYFCRPRQPPCESGMPADPTKRADACKSKEGCHYQGNCYCPCDDKRNPKYGSCNCACGGGLPPDCRNQSDK